MSDLPSYITFVFGLTTLLTIWFFYRAARRSRTVLYVLFGWILVQSAIALTGFYLKTDAFPPRFIFLVFPPVLFIVILFLTRRGKIFIDSLNEEFLTLLHIVRVPVEIVLFWLFTWKLVPQLMTFEGRNFDIISGITAPLVYYFGYTTKGLGRRMILIWNFVCIALLVNIVTLAVLSAPFPFQQFAFDQPNTGVFYFPFIWLPWCIVPLVLFSHLVCIRKLLQR